MFATLKIPEGSFVCEYKGVLMSAKEGREKEKQYDSEGQGNFLYFFEWKGNKYWLVFYIYSKLLLIFNYYRFFIFLMTDLWNVIIY